MVSGGLSGTVDSGFGYDGDEKTQHGVEKTMYVRSENDRTEFARERRTTTSVWKIAGRQRVRSEAYGFYGPTPFLPFGFVRGTGDDIARCRPHAWGKVPSFRLPQARPVRPVSCIVAETERLSGIGTAERRGR